MHVGSRNKATKAHVLSKKLNSYSPARGTPLNSPNNQESSDMQCATKTQSRNGALKWANGPSLKGLKRHGRGYLINSIDGRGSEIASSLIATKCCPRMSLKCTASKHLPKGKLAPDDLKLSDMLTHNAQTNAIIFSVRGQLRHLNCRKIVHPKHSHCHHSYVRFQDVVNHDQRHNLQLNLPQGKEDQNDLLNSQ